jgi:hypothetical protein
MKILKFKPPEWLKNEFRWADDVDRIVKVCAARGYFISDADAHHAWEEWSDCLAASWLVLDEDDDELFRNVMEQCEVIENGN